MEPVIHSSPEGGGRLRPRRLRYLLLLALTLPLCGCIELLGALVGGCMFITAPLLAELGVPGPSGPATKRPLLTKVAF